MGSSTPRDSQISGAPDAPAALTHGAAGDFASLAERHLRDPRSFVPHRHDLVADELDPQRPGLAPVCLEERVGVDVSLVAVAQKSSGDVAGAKPRAARVQLVGGSEVDIRTEIALHPVVVEHRRQHRLGRDQQVAVFPETHVGGLAVDGEVVVEVLEELDSEQPDPDVLGRGELLPESPRGLCRRRIPVGRIAFDDQNRAFEFRLAGKKQRRGAAGDAAPRDHNVVSVVSVGASIHPVIIPRLGSTAGTGRHGDRCASGARTAIRDPLEVRRLSPCSPPATRESLSPPRPSQAVRPAPE